MKIRIQLLALLATPAFAQSAPNPAVDAIFAKFTQSGSPGCALGVYRDGKIIYSKGYGLASVEMQVPITPASVFDIGSTSKQFTAASILLLEKQGKLRLDDDIHKYLPELADYGTKVTILNLLNHTSGIRDYLTLFEMAGINMDGVTTDDTALAMLARQKALNFPPGNEFLYSNSGYFLLSIIVKRVSGKSLREFAQENIFTPLGMTHTEYRDDHGSLIPNRALAYDPAPRGGFRLDVSYFEQMGDGAVHTSAEDLLRWDENFYTGRVGGKEFLAELQTPGKLNNGKVLGYAKGLDVGTYRGLRAVRHGGAWGGYRAELLRFPEQHFSVACLCNLGTAEPESLAEQTADVFLAGQMKPKERRPTRIPHLNVSKDAAAPDPSKLAVFVGEYACEELGAIYKLAILNGRLSIAAILDSSGFPRTTTPVALRATGENQFLMVDQPAGIRFAKDGSGQPASFVLNAGRTKGLVFTRVPAASSSSTAKQP